MALPEIGERLYSAEDFWEFSHLPDNQSKRLQLIEGVIHEMPPAGGEHGGMALDLGSLIRGHVKAHDLGYTTAAETGYILFNNPDGKDTVVAPDVGFIAKARLPQGLPKGYIPLAPDLAVEVVSPGDSADGIDQKVVLYLRYGTRLVWIWYPKTKTVIAHTTTGLQRFGISDTLDGGDVLPGFKLSIREIFSA
jgi:Uma2 family endonuclease